jgi:hypothetical protein
MTIRTIQIFGQGYGASPAQITATANGNTVFSSTVPTVDQPLPSLPNPALIDTMAVLFTLETDTAFTGAIPMTCAVESGTVIFARILANYVSIPNPVYSPAQLDVLRNPGTSRLDKVAIFTQVATPSLSQQEIDVLLDPAEDIAVKDAILAAHNCLTLISSGADGYGPIVDTDPRSNVAVDGVAQSPDTRFLSGTWWWIIPKGSTLSYDLAVGPATV